MPNAATGAGIEGAVGIPIVRQRINIIAAGQSFHDRLPTLSNTTASVLHDLTRQVNTWTNEQGNLSQGSLQAMDNLYRELGGQVLGIIPDAVESRSNADREDGLVRLLIDLRAQARAKKDWATGDQIRNQLKELGIVLEDRVDGTIWKVAE